MSQYKFTSWVTAAVLLASPLYAQTAPTRTTSSDAEDDEVIVLSPFQINSDRDRGYASTTSLGASRIALDVNDISASVVSLNEQVFADRGAISTMEVLNLVSGVQRTSDLLPGQEQFTLRGYAVGGLSLRDGLPDPMSAADNPFDESSAYERVEIIKGPAGTLYGSTSMGGIVNKISKWPKFQPETKIELQAQSYDQFLRAMVDSTGPLSEDTAYRVVLSARKGDRYYDEGDAPNDVFNSTVSLTHLVGENDSGKIWGRLQYLDFSLDRENGWQFISGYLDPNDTTAPMVKDSKFPVAFDANTVPEDDVSEAEIYALEAGYEQAFSGPLNGDWTLRLIGRFSKGEGDKSPSYSQGRPVPVDASGNIVTYINASGVATNGDNRYVSADDPRVDDWRATVTLRDFRGYNQSAGGFLDLVGNFETGPLSHKLVMSGELTRGERERAFFFWAASNPGNTTAVTNSYSAVAPDFTGVTAASIQASSTTNFNAFQGHVDGDSFAFAFQDNISLMEDKLIFALGARYDSLDATNQSFDKDDSIAAGRFVVDPSKTVNSSNSDSTYKFGVVAKPSQDVSIFGQISQTFSPITSLDENGNKNPNQEGEMKEVGVKVNLLGGRMVGTVSYFDMELTNVLLTVVNPIELGGGVVLRPVGLQATDGIEFDLSAEVTTGFNVGASYSNITSTDAVGRFFRGVPMDANYALFGRYAFQTDSLDGLVVGGAWKHNGSAPGDSGNSYFLPDNNQVDAFIAYSRDQWSLQLNVTNVFDDDSTLSAVTDRLAIRAMPRAARLTFRYQF